MTWFANRAERREAEALTRYWDDLVRRTPALPVTPPEAPRVPSAVIRRLQTLETKDETRPAYEDALLERLLASYETEPDMSTATVAVSLPPITPGRRANDVPRSRSPLPGSLGRQASRAIAFIVVAAIILGIVGGIWLASRPNDGVNNIQPASTPVVETTPDDGSNFPMYRGNSGRSGVVNAPGPSGSPVELWTVTGLPAALSWSSAIVDGVLYAGGGSDGLIAFDAMTGERLWNFQTQFPVDSGPAVESGMVFFADSEGTLFAVDIATREERWSMAGTRPNSGAAFFGDLVYAVTPEGTLYALNRETGEIVWETALGANAAGAPAVADGIVVQNGTDHTVRVFDALTGELRWSFVGGVGSSPGIDAGMATPTIAHGVVYATTDGPSNDMYALDVASGELIWQIHREIGYAFLSATATTDRVFSISEDGVLHALDARDGTEIWRYELGLLVRTIPIVAGDTLYTVDNRGFVRAISAVNGSEIWSYPVEGSFLYNLSVAGEVVYTGTDLGNLYAITGSDSLTIGVESEKVPSLLSTPDPSSATSPEAALSNPGTIVIDAAVTGAPGDPLQFPLNLAEAPDGRIWVTDGNNSRFQIFEPDGTFVEMWGERGAEEGQFNFLRGNGEGFGAIAFAPDGSFWVADTGNARIQHFGADRTFLSAHGERGNEPGQLVSAINIGVDSFGNVWVNDDRRGMLIKYGPDGEFLFEVGGRGPGPGSLIDQAVMRVAADDTVWVTGSTGGFLNQWSNDGTLIGSWEHGSLAPGIVWTASIDFDEAGNLYIFDPATMQVLVLTPDMTPVGTWKIVHADGSIPTAVLAMIVLSDGSLALSDADKGTLLIFHLDPPADTLPVTSKVISGTVVGEVLITGPADAPMHMTGNLAEAPDGRIWIADGANSRFQIFESDGTFVEIWGEPGGQDGQFNFVRANGDGFGAVVFAPDGSFWVADTGNARIQHFDANRAFLSTFGERGTDPGQLISPIGVGLDSSGNIWVNDDRLNKLLKFAPDGSFLFDVGGTGSGPDSLENQSGMHVGPDDSVWVTGSINGRIQRWSSEGDLLGSWEPAVLPGSPTWTSAIDFDTAGNLYILDPDGHQILVLTPELELIGSWGIAYANGSRFDVLFSAIVLSDGRVAIPDVFAGTVLLGHLEPPFTP